MARSDWPAVATVVLTVALLLLGLGSVVVAETWAVSVIVVPEAVPIFTETTTVNVVEVLAARLAFEQVSVPLAAPQVQPVAGEGVAET